MPLRSLAIVVARFEQMLEPPDGAPGIVSRMVLDALGEVGADPALVADRRSELEEATTALGITIPDELPEYEASSIFATLKFEMDLAKTTVSGSYAPVGFHVVREGGERDGYHTQLEAGPLTEMIASACVIAELNLLRCAAQLFEWDLEENLDEIVGTGTGT